MRQQPHLIAGCPLGLPVVLSGIEMRDRPSGSNKRRAQPVFDIPSANPSRAEMWGRLRSLHLQYVLDCADIVHSSTALIHGTLGSTNRR